MKLKGFLATTILAAALLSMPILSQASTYTLDFNGSGGSNVGTVSYNAGTNLFVGTGITVSGVSAFKDDISVHSDVPVTGTLGWSVNVAPTYSSGAIKEWRFGDYTTDIGTFKINGAVTLGTTTVSGDLLTGRLQGVDVTMGSTNKVSGAFAVVITDVKPELIALLYGAGAPTTGYDGTLTTGWRNTVLNNYVAGIPSFSSSTMTSTDINVTGSAVPLPSAMLLLGPGLAGLAIVRKRISG